MRSECVKGPFVTALPMTLSGIVKGINTLRARATVNRSLFFPRFFIGATAIDAADGKQNAGTRSIGHRMCLSIFLGLSLYFVRTLSPVRYIKAEKLRDRAPTPLAICMVLFSCYSSRIIFFFNRVSSYSFSNCYKTNLETYRLEIFK